jgi:hypothetical protein
MLELVPILLVGAILANPTISWTQSIVVSRRTRATTHRNYDFDRACHRRSLLLHENAISLGSFRIGDSRSRSPLSFLSTTTALRSTKSNPESKIDTNISAKGWTDSASNLEINYGNNNSTGSLLLVEPEGDEHKPGKTKEITAEATLPTPSSAIHEVAIVLNTNAKGVTEDLVNTARTVVEDIQKQKAKSSTTLPNVRLLVTSTYEKARSAAREILEASATTPATTMVIPVGGDGTLTTMINLLWEEHRSKTIEEDFENKFIDEDNRFPIVFGYVAMGTGNALGSVVGCLPRKHRQTKRSRALGLLRRCLRPQATKCENFGLVLSQLIEAAAETQSENGAEGTTSMPVDVMELPLIRVRTTLTETNGKVSYGSSESTTQNDQYAFFAGLGYDSLLLQDYKDLQDWTDSNDRKSTPWKGATTGVVGYTVAMVTRSLPKLLKLEDASRLLRDVRITTDDPESAYWIDHRRGDVLRPAISSSDNAMDKTEKLLYRGSAGIVATSTVPYYGGGLRLFPFARMTPHGMQLRIGRNLHPLEGISKIPSIFEGSFRDKSSGKFQCLDFVGTQFTVEIYESYKYDNNAKEEKASLSDSDKSTEEGFPVQHSGESMGRCTRVEFTVSSKATPEILQQEQNTDSHPIPSTAKLGSKKIDPMPSSMRFLTLMPPRLSEERIDADLF